jgi:hypothetical protein
MKREAFFRSILMRVEVDRLIMSTFSGAQCTRTPSASAVLPWCTCIHRERTDAKGVFRYVPLLG